MTTAVAGSIYERGAGTFGGTLQTPVRFVERDGRMVALVGMHERVVLPTDMNPQAEVVLWQDTTDEDLAAVVATGYPARKRTAAEGIREASYWAQIRLAYERGIHAGHVDW